MSAAPSAAASPRWWCSTSTAPSSTTVPAPGRSSPTSSSRRAWAPSGAILAKARIDVDDATQKAILAFWKKRFFSQEYQRFDVPLPGAVAFVRRLYDEGATVCYLTGRDYPGMGVGCLSSLHSFGFPASLMRTAMVLKPDFETPDLDFKRDALGFIDQLGTVVASFDNEPGNCNLFAERWPQALVGLADTSHAPGAPPLDAGVIRFDDFLS
jgi:hypothetical protein